MTALGKMHELQIDCICEKEKLYVKISDQIYIFESVSKEEIQNIPTNILKQLLEKKNIVKEKK